MGISAGGGRGGPNSDINVTPLVDVVLVLLIIFIVTIPVQMQHIDIEVPETAPEQVESTIAPITVTGMFDGSVRLDDGAVQTMVTRGALAASLRKLLNAQGLKKVVFVDFENELPWDQVVSILDTVKGVGKGFEQGVRIAIRTRDPSVAAPNSP